MRPLLHLALLIPFTLQAQPALERLFYYVDRESSYDAFVKHADRIDVLGVGGYRVDSLGILWGSVDRGPRAGAAAQRQVMPLLVNELPSPSLRRLLADTAGPKSRHSRDGRRMPPAPLLGMQFDIENVPIDDRDAASRAGMARRPSPARGGVPISNRRVHRPTELADIELSPLHVR